MVKQRLVFSRPTRVLDLGSDVPTIPVLPPEAGSEQERPFRFNVFPPRRHVVCRAHDLQPLCVGAGGLARDDQRRQWQGLRRRKPIAGEGEQREAGQARESVVPGPTSAPAGNSSMARQPGRCAARPGRSVHATSVPQLSHKSTAATECLRSTIHTAVEAKQRKAQRTFAHQSTWRGPRAGGRNRLSVPDHHPAVGQRNVGKGIVAVPIGIPSRRTACERSSEFAPNAGVRASHRPGRPVGESVASATSPFRRNST